jgi:CRP-like cAMP-binding protein
MSNQLIKRVLPANDYIFKEGAIGSEAYLIMDGHVEIRLGAFGDNPKLLAKLGTGDVIGEMSLFDKKPHMASAMIMEKTTVTVLTADTFKKRVEEMDPVMRGIITVMIKRLRKVGDNKAIKMSDTDWNSWQH